MSIGVKEIAFTGYPVTDMDRSRKFYGDVLGLTEADIFSGKDGTASWVEYDIQGQTLAIAMASEHWQPHPQGGGVALEVESLETALEKLNEHGVESPMPIGDFPICRMAVISDPDGNGIVLHQRKADHPDFIKN